MNNLIDTVVQQANSVANTPELPPNAQMAQVHAKEFVDKTAPLIRMELNKSATFVAFYEEQRLNVTAALNAWKNGKDADRKKLMVIVANIESELATASAASSTAANELDMFRIKTTIDQQNLTTSAQKIKAKIARAKYDMEAKARELKSLQRNISIMRWNPLAYVLSELGNLITKSKTLEQELADIQIEYNSITIMDLRLQTTLSIMTHFQNSLTTLLGSLGNLTNLISIIKGKISQIDNSIQSSNNGVCVVVEAYFATMDKQVASLRQSVGEKIGKAIAA